MFSQDVTRMNEDFWREIKSQFQYFTAIQHKYLDWKDFLVKRLTGARTLPQNFYNKVQECLQNTPIKTGMFVEVVDKMCVSAMRVGTVEDVIGGRLKLHYIDSKVTLVLMLTIIQ